MKAVEPAGCKVVMQYHSGGERVYELADGAANLEVRISSVAVSPGERSWHVAAQPGRAADSVVITESAETKANALAKVAALWSEREAELGLPKFDWKAVTAALLAVRAI